MSTSNITLKFTEVSIPPSPHRRRGTPPTSFEGCLLAASTTKVSEEPFYSTVRIYLLPTGKFIVIHERYSLAPDDCRNDVLSCHNLRELIGCVITLQTSLQQRYNEAFREWACPLSLNDTDTGEEPLTTC